MLTQVAPSRRTIAVVPALLVMLLADGGKLPRPPRLPDPDALGFRQPTFSDMDKMVWVGHWRGPQMGPNGFNAPTGIAAYIERFDYHRSVEATEIIMLAGTPRACYDLVRRIHFDAEAKGRHCVGSFDLENIGLRRLLSRMNHTERRITVEAN